MLNEIRIIETEEEGERARRPNPRESGGRRARAWLRTPSGRRLGGWVERALFAAALVLLGIWGAVRLEGEWFQVRQERLLAERLAARAAEPGSSPADAPALFEPGQLVGRIDVERLGISSVIVEGTDTVDLRHAVGHLPGTALPGASGNVALAGHRDSYFRGLGGVELGDRIVVTSTAGTFDYVVESTEVVDPDRVEVLAPTETPTLTLLTCYPFRYVGPAPQRFVVRARLAGRAEQPVKAAAGSTVRLAQR